MEKNQTTATLTDLTGDAIEEISSKQAANMVLGGDYTRYLRGRYI
jgi:hypothetical protein